MKLQKCLYFCNNFFVGVQDVLPLLRLQIILNRYYNADTTQYTNIRQGDNGYELK